MTKLPTHQRTELSGAVALVGAPNSGKTSVYNWLTESKARAVNYPGSTVEFSCGTSASKLKHSYTVIDTPGVQSLVARSKDEEVTLKVLFHGPDGAGPAKMVIAVIDATQLSRHLMIVRQLLASDFKLVVALTMTDLLSSEGERIDTVELSKRLDCPVIPVNGLTGEGIELLSEASARVLCESPRKPKPVEVWTQDRKTQIIKENIILSEAVKVRDIGSEKRMSSRERTNFYDRFLIHPIFGFLFFFLTMSVLFTSIFWAATPAMDLVDTAFSWMIEQTIGFFPEGSLVGDLLGNGVVAALGAVLIFVPQVAILFFGITLLEDSGYLARAATLIDRPLSFFGMNGRSFVPLLSGYACAIPAMMATRTISSPRQRWITLFIIPLLSCSARLPVYALLLAFLFVGAPAWQPGVALALIYLVSLVVGAVAAGVLHRILGEKEQSFLLLELPRYRRPNWRVVLNHVKTRTMGYILKAGPAIFVFAVALWAFTTFPNYKAETEVEKLSTSYAAQVGRMMEPVMEPMGGDWRTGTSLLAAFAAREVFVAALAITMNVSGEDDDSVQEGLLTSMKEATRPDGSPLFTISSSIGLILFFMIALQCMATVGVARREFGSWKAPIAQLVVFNVVAYALTVAVVQGLRAFGVS